MGYPLAPNQQELTPLQSSFLIEAFILEQEEEVAAQERAERGDGGTPLNVAAQDGRSRENASQDTGGIGGARPDKKKAPAKPKPHPVNKPIKGKSLTALARERRGDTVGKTRKTAFKKKR